MNKVILMGRLVRDPDIRYSNGENATAVPRNTLAVDSRMLTSSTAFLLEKALSLRKNI